MGRGGRYPYDLAHHPVTAALTNEEYEALKRAAGVEGMKPSTFLTWLIRQELQKEKHLRATFNELLKVPAPFDQARKKRNQQ